MSEIHQLSENHVRKYSHYRPKIVLLVYRLRFQYYLPFDCFQNLAIQMEIPL